MATLPHAQSIDQFAGTVRETISRVASTREAEGVTVDGEMKVVVVEVQEFERLRDEAEAAGLRRAREQIAQGEWISPQEMHRRLRDTLDSHAQDSDATA